MSEIACMLANSLIMVLILIQNKLFSSGLKITTCSKHIILRPS